MKLYFIRHGQTWLNIERKFNGEVDESLSDLGHEQAREAGKFFKDKKVDLIYCSPMLRTRQTLEGLGLDKDIPVIYDERIVERREGALVGQVNNDDLYNNIYLNRYNKVKIEGLETIDEVKARVDSFIEDLKKKYTNENILIVSHGFVGRIFYFNFNGYPENGMLGECEAGHMNNCEVREYNL